MAAEMVMLALGISTIMQDEHSRWDLGLCPFYLFVSVRELHFAGCFGDLLVVARFQCRLGPVGCDAFSLFYGVMLILPFEFHGHNVIWDQMKCSSHLIVIKLLIYLYHPHLSFHQENRLC